jgi:hypothetical protein
MFSKIDFGKRVRLLEDHPDAPAQPDDVDTAAVDVLAVDLTSLDAVPG